MIVGQLLEILFSFISVQITVLLQEFADYLFKIDYRAIYLSAKNKSPYVNVFPRTHPLLCLYCIRRHELSMTEK